MAYPIEHKTVFVLDKSPHFAKSCKESIEYDALSKVKAPGVIPSAPITKSLWTCNVETMVEYMRIVYDIFPASRMIQVVVGEQSLNSWSKKEQNIQQIMLALGHVGPPSVCSKEDDYDLLHSLSHAIEALCEQTENQQQYSPDDVQNKGRIICLTSARSEAQIRMFEEYVQDAMNQHNKIASSSDTLLPIQHCELVIIHIVRVGDEIKITDKSLHQVSTSLSCEVHTTRSGRNLYNKIIHLVQRHYGLASTTVTGIPMKEEQNASSSANYDVELLHPSEAHDDLLKSAHADGLVIPSKEGLPTDTITLKWCTPKSNVIELNYCTGAYRITPVDVNSRPSSCLTNFLLSGRAVMLEQPRKSGNKVISHLLASHGGEIFVHAMNTSRSLLEDPPSISEGCGGRVTDYRINDFGEFMKENRLAPATPAMISSQKELWSEKAKKRLERMSRYWPMVISETIIFNMASHIDPLPSLIVKDSLDDEEVMECKKAVYHVVGMESRNEALPIQLSGTRGKGPKRDELYRQMWSELEKLIEAYADTSPNHQKVLDCLNDCKKPTEDKSPKKADKVFVKEEKMDADSQFEQSLKTLEKFQKMTEREKQDYDKSSLPSVKRLKTEEPNMTTGSGPQNLLSLWTNRISSIHSKRHVEFAGRVGSKDNVAELYQHMKEDNGSPMDTNSKDQQTRV